MMMSRSECRRVRSSRGSVKFSKNGAKSSRVVPAGIPYLRSRVPIAGASFGRPLTKSTWPANNHPAGRPQDAIALPPSPAVADVADGLELGHVALLRVRL